ncbi:MAG: CvpA family protein [Candidatus Scalindua sp.]|jgi:uncharacterized membrane protein required for colicin V production|nr:CvpA family protein [Candidatus Scalindua sp.]MDV5166391.1 CvpA family protein [Candidatus Scalindua sp.]
MNWLDFILIGVITLGTLFGIITGPLWQIYRISSVALSVAASLLLHRLLSSIIKGIFSPKVSSILGYAVIFGITLVVTYAVGNLFRKFLIKRKFGMSGRLIGGGISFTKTVITCCVIIAGVSFWGNSQTRKTIDESMIAKNLDNGTKKVIPLFPQEIKDMAIKEKEVHEEKETSEEKQ